MSDRQKFNEWLDQYLMNKGLTRENLTHGEIVQLRFYWECNFN